MIRFHLLILLPHRLLIIITVAVFSLLLSFLHLLATLSHALISTPSPTVKSLTAENEIKNISTLRERKRIRNVFLNTSCAIPSTFLLFSHYCYNRQSNSEAMECLWHHFISYSPDQRDFSLTRYPWLCIILVMNILFEM